MQSKGKIETHVGIFVLIALGIFVYMGFQIGAFRFDRGRYAQYTLYFNDISGLARKAEVKIAGVKVGWVEKIELIKDHVTQAQAQIMVLKDYVLYEDSHAVVRQDGLLGPKYLELIPGDPLLPAINHGGVLGKPSVAPVSIDELMHKFSRIAGNVEEVTHSLKETMGGVQGQEQLQSIFDNFNNAAEKIASVSTVLESAFARNEGNLDSILEIGNHVRRVADKLEDDVLPSFRDSVDKIAQVFDRDFNRLTDKLSTTAESLEEASIQVRDSFSHINSVTEKIDEGKGLLGKLINEDETYRDLRVTVQGLKNYFSKVNMIQVVFDGHGERMHRPAENYRFEDSKFYFDMRIHPNEENFYLIELASSEKGWRSEQEIIKTYVRNNERLGTYVSGADYDIPNPNDLRHEINTNDLLLTDDDRLEDAFRKKETILTRNTVKFGIQFGKIFKDLALRFGIFENTGGLAFDYDIPFPTPKFRWVTSFEVFDLNGWNRVNDRRPHFKWLNRMFFMRNIYFTFGADDFVSKHNGSAFFGAGIRFGDDDIKYLMPSIGGSRGLAQ